MMPPSPSATQRQGSVGITAVAPATVRGMGADATRAPLHLDPAATGTSSVKVLVILAEFPDAPATHQAGDYDSLLFATTRAGGSVRSYYRENSYGALDVTGRVEGPWLTLPQPRDYYANATGGLPGANGSNTYPRNAQGMAEEAILRADRYVDFSQYDGNGDGYVDYLIIVHSGRGKEQTDNPLDIWSHTWTTSRDILVDGVRVSNYSTVPEDCQIGVCAHEYGHQLGLPDLYTARGAGIGMFSLMATGAWGGVSLEGDHPTQLDPWCKARLGFLRPTVLTRNLAAATLAPVETTPVAWKLWTIGAPAAEYFLVENRQYIGQDDVHPTDRFRGLPNAGFVIYHIDDAVPGNLRQYGQDASAHLQVALVEADGDTLGRGTIDRVLREWGLPSDVFGVPPQDVHVWDQNTVPSSRDYGLRDTQVALRGMRLASTTAVADVEVANAPALRGDGVEVRDEGGNAGGVLYAGGRAVVVPRVRNRGLAARDVTARLSLVDPYATSSGGVVEIGSVASDTLVRAPQSDVMVQMHGEVPSDPYPLPVIFELSGTGGAPGVTTTVRDTVLVPSGAIFSFGDDAESSLPRFRDVSPRTDVRARWRRSAQHNTTAGGSFAWRCGSDVPGGAYDARLDMALESQPFQLDGTGTLSFQSFIDAEGGSPGITYDGGVVELAVGDGPWNPLELDGGYPYLLRAPQGGLTDGLVGRGALGGHDAAPHRYTASLAGLQGIARLRFRFVSDASVGFDGWTVDDILVDTDTQPYVVLPMDPVADDSGVQLSWRVVESRGPYARPGFTLYQASAPLGTLAGTVQRPLGALQRATGNAASSLLRSVRVPSAVTAVSYVLVDSSATGASRLYTFSSNQAPVRFAVSPLVLQVGRGSATIRFQATSSDGRSVPVRVDVLDVQGRRVATLADGPRYPGPQVVVWDGRRGVGSETAGPPGARVATGMYFVSVQAGGTRYMAKLPVMR